jgi:hypothetical protein
MTKDWSIIPACPGAKIVWALTQSGKLDKPKFVEDILVAWRVHMPTCNPEIISQVRKETYAEPVGLSRSGHYPCLEAYLIIGTDGLLLDNNLVSYASIDDWKQQFLEWWDYLLNYKSEDEIPSVAAQSERRT